MNAPQDRVNAAESRVWVLGRPWSRWRTVRLCLILTWIVALGFFWLTGAAFAARSAKMLSVILVPVVLWPWFRGPYLLYTRRSRPLRADFSIQEIKQDSTRLAHYEQVLFQLGFKLVTYLKEESSCVTHVGLYIHPANMDTAHLAQVSSAWGSRYLFVFETRFEDGFIFESSNSTSVEMFPSNPNHRLFRFPQLRSQPDLYRIHQKLKQRFSTTRRPVVGTPAEELRGFIVRAEEAHRRIGEMDYKLNDGKDRYVYTLHGAIRHAWLLTFPVKQFKQMRVATRAMKTADGLGLPINPKFGCLVESIQKLGGPPNA